jgi:hypothetical protein
MGRMSSLLMAVAFTGGMIASPGAFAQGSGSQGGAGTDLRTQTTQTAPVGRGQGGVGRGLGPCGSGGGVTSGQQGAGPCPGLAGQGRGGPGGKGAMMGTGPGGAGKGRGMVGQGMGPRKGPPAQ